MKVFGDPRAKAKVRRYIMWGIEDGIVCASFIAGIALAGCSTLSSRSSASHETPGGRIYVTGRAGHATPE